MDGGGEIGDDFDGENFFEVFGGPIGFGGREEGWDDGLGGRAGAEFHAFFGHCCCNFRKEGFGD